MARHRRGQVDCGAPMEERDRETKTIERVKRGETCEKRLCRDRPRLLLSTTGESSVECGFNVRLPFLDLVSFLLLLLHLLLYLLPCDRLLTVYDSNQLAVHDTRACPLLHIHVAAMDRSNTKHENSRPLQSLSPQARLWIQIESICGIAFVGSCQVPSLALRLFISTLEH